MEMPISAVLGGSRKPRRAQSEDPNGSPRTGAGAYACQGRSSYIAHLGHDVRLLQAGKARRVPQRQVLPGNTSQRIRLDSTVQMYRILYRSSTGQTAEPHRVLRR